ncbi:MAG TPA: SRPBCC domain-containing protein [Polyangiaceae bacterium]
MWRALTDPEIVPLWTSTGRGGTPVGFAAVVGTRFKFVGKPTIGWGGVVDCEVVEVREPRLLRFTWRGGEDDDLTTVTWLVDAHDGGTRLTCEHTGFKGLRGFLMARLLGSVRKKMLDVGLPAALREIR